MPLTSKGQKILSSMESEYGSEKKAKSILYAGKNSGKFKGIDARRARAIVDAVGGRSWVNKNGSTGYEIETGGDEASVGEPAMSSPVSGLAASSRERGMSISDARRIVRDFGSQPSSAQKIGEELPKPANDKLPTRRAFARYIRDKVAAGVPLPKVLQAGVTWGVNPGSHSTWQPYDMRDARSFVRIFRDARRRGFSIQDAIRKAVDEAPEGRLDLGEVGGNGIPMSGPQGSAGMSLGGS